MTTFDKTPTMRLNSPRIGQKLKLKRSDNPVDARSHSIKVAKKLKLKRADYPADVLKLIMKLRSASFKMGGTDMAKLFRKLDKDKSDVLDVDEFKLTIRRFVACWCTHVLCWIRLRLRWLIVAHLIAWLINNSATSLVYSANIKKKEISDKRLGKIFRMVCFPTCCVTQSCLLPESPPDNRLIIKHSRRKS